MLFGKKNTLKRKVLQAEEALAGGVVSKVMAGTLTDKRTGSVHHVVVKQTGRKAVGGPQFSYSDKHLIHYAPRTHSLDAKILSLLQNDPHVRVPDLHHSSKRENASIMTDFRKQGFKLMQELLVANRLPIESAAASGTSLAYLHKRFTQKPFTGLRTVENPLSQARERLQEIHVLLYDNLDQYRNMERKLLTDDGLIYTDGHPKNIAVNAKGEVMLFDFGRSIHGSLQFPAPNFAAHVGLAVLAGCLPADFGVKYIREFVGTYQNVLPIDEKWFVKFFVAEVVHRGLAMRWIDKRIANASSPDELKIASHLLYIRAFGADRIQTVEGLLEQLSQIARLVKTNKISQLVRAKP